MDEIPTVLRDMKICRFCLNTDEKELSTIYHKEPKTVPLPVQIMSCVSIEVFAHDGLPQLICNNCKQQINYSYVFKSNCRKANDALRNLLATAEFVKPKLQKLPPEPKKRPTSSLSPLKHIEIAETKTSLSLDKVKNANSKRVKLEDGTEIITLCFTESGDCVAEEKSQEIGEKNASFMELGEEDECETYHIQDVGDSDKPFRFSESTIKPVETSIFPCDLCDRTFPLKQLLDLHVAKHTRERNFCCSFCDSKFYTNSDLVKHSKTHGNQKSFSCSVCNKSFYREALLRRHEQVHSDIGKYMCSHCERTFLVKTDLDVHVKKHEKKRPYLCKECDKSFVFKQGLERHMQSFHSQEKPHKCNYCEASFSSQIRLTRHITSHAGLRPYPCKICGRTFLLSHHLTRHMRSHYAVEKPEEAVGQHKCDVCSMSFRRKDSLINHSAIHSMVNLRCVICDTKFETADEVKEHITTHLQGLPFPCEKCDYSFETLDQLEQHQVKHAEMEYEEQIEKEVISEVKLVGKTENADRPGNRQEESVEDEEEEDEEEEEYEDDEEEEEGEYTEFTITNTENPELIPAKVTEVTETYSSTLATSDFTPDISPPKYTYLNVSKNPPQELNNFFKTEIEEDGEEEEVLNVASDEGNYGGEDFQEKAIKPIVRVEGTKVYERKGPIQRKIPNIQASLQQAQTAPLDQINQKPPGIDGLNIAPDTLNHLPAAQDPVSVKVGDKVVKVQKFIISKDEMKQMAKLGIIEVKNGRVIMKNPGKPILNATIKPVQQSDIENLLNSQKQNRPPLKQYERKGHSQNVSEGSGEAVIDLEQ